MGKLSNYTATESPAKRAIGKMRYLVDIYNKIIINDGIGGDDGDWAKSYTIWADVIKLSSNEALSYGLTISTSPINVVLRKGIEINEESQIHWNNEVFNVISIEDNDEKYFDVICSKRG